MVAAAPHKKEREFPERYWRATLTDPQTNHTGGIDPQATAILNTLHDRSRKGGHKIVRWSCTKGVLHVCFKQAAGHTSSAIVKNLVKDSTTLCAAKWEAVGKEACDQAGKGEVGESDSQGIKPEKWGQQRSTKKRAKKAKAITVMPIAPDSPGTQPNPVTTPWSPLMLSPSQGPEETGHAHDHPTFNMSDLVNMAETEPVFPVATITVPVVLGIPLGQGPPISSQLGPPLAPPLGPTPGSREVSENTLGMIVDSFVGDSDALLGMPYWPDVPQRENSDSPVQLADPVGA